MESNWTIPVLISILIIGTLGYQEAFAVDTIISDETSCESVPVLGDFDSGTCTLSGTHTVPVDDRWTFMIDSKVTGTVDVFGFLQFQESFSNSGTINVIGATDPPVVDRGFLRIVQAGDKTNECDGIINLIGGTFVGSGRLNIEVFGPPTAIFNNFGTITGTNTFIGSNLIATVNLLSSGSSLVFNNHGTLTAPVATGSGTTFNDNLPDQCITIGGTYIPIDQSALLLAGVQSVSMWMIPVILAGIGIGVFVIKRRK